MKILSFKKEKERKCERASERERERERRNDKEKETIESEWEGGLFGESRKTKNKLERTNKKKI